MFLQEQLQALLHLAPLSINCSPDVCHLVRAQAPRPRITFTHLFDTFYAVQLMHSKRMCVRQRLGIQSNGLT